MRDPRTGEFYPPESCQEVLARAPATQIVLHKMDPAAIPDWCRLPGDWNDEPAWATLYHKIPKTHPRLARSHGTCLRIAREKDIPLMQILAASSYNPAKYLGDTGIPYVIVNGTVVVRDSKVLKGVNPGHPIRFPKQEKSRFEPLDVGAWKAQYLVPPVGFNALDDESLHLH
jgi:hypothetical protein